MSLFMSTGSLVSAGEKQRQRDNDLLSDDAWNEDRSRALVRMQVCLQEE